MGLRIPVRSVATAFSLTTGFPVLPKVWYFVWKSGERKYTPGHRAELPDDRELRLVSRQE